MSEKISLDSSEQKDESQEFFIDSFSCFNDVCCM